MILTTFRRSDFILLGGVLTGLLFYVGGEQTFSSLGLNASLLFYSRFLFWGLVLLLFLYARIVEKNDFFIWKDRPYKFLYYVASVIVLYLLGLACGLIAFTPRLFGWHETSAARVALEMTISKNFLLLVFAALTAGVTEELIFRAYLVPRFQILFSNKAAAVIVSALMFSAAHYRYYSLIQFIGTFLFGIVFAIHYQKYRNIKMLIIAHTLMDLIAFLAFWFVHVKMHLPVKESFALF
jgi:membrane protease YdiL (CAAX protease family)